MVTLTSDLPLTLCLWKTGDIARDKNLSTCQVPSSWPWFILLEWNAPLHSLTPLEWSNTQTFWCPPSPTLPTSSQFTEAEVAPASRNWAVLTRYCIFLPATLICPLYSSMLMPWEWGLARALLLRGLLWAPLCLQLPSRYRVHEPAQSLHSLY